MTIKNETTQQSINILENIAGEKLTLGSMLSSIRKCDEISQASFAKTLGVSKQYLCDIEKRRRFVSPKAATGFAKKLGYSEVLFLQLCFQDMLDRDGLAFEVNIRAA